MTKNRTISEVSLKDVLDQVKREVMFDINCHALGVVEKFDSAKQTCMVKVDYLKTKLVKNSTGTYESQIFKYPLLLDCPAIIMTGGNTGVTVPINQGDSCVILFNDRDIDNWSTGASESEVATGRLHSISDGLVLVGARNSSNKIEDYDSENPHMWNGDTGIRVKSDKVLIENSTDKLGALLRELIDEIKAIATTNAIVGSPSTISPASQALIEIVAIKIEGLLE